MKRLFILVIILLAFTTTEAQEIYRFRTNYPQGFSKESSTETALSLHFSITELGIATIQYDQAKGQEIILKGCFASNAEGQPNLPFANQYIAVPRDSQVSIEVREKASETLQGIELLPAAPLQMNCEDERPTLHWDMDVFGKDADYPSKNVTIAHTTQIRGLDVALIQVTPFRYNPVRKTLEVIYEMDIEVRFEGGNGQFGNPRYRHPAWDGILRNLVINNDMLPESEGYSHLNQAIENREEGCEYLIITIDNPTFTAWADTLKAFRTKQGILTKVVTTADCGGNEPQDIRNFILNAYNHWDIPPAAVLLFGGNHKTNPSFGLKPFIFRSPESWGHTYRYPTDNPFADMNGDSIPDLAISRMTALNANQCQIQVEKLIEYELNPPTDPHHYAHPIINSGYQDTKWFAITAQVTNNFFRDRKGKHPGNVYMKYWYEDYNPTPPDSIWSIANNTSTVLDYFGPNGAQYIPLSIGYLDNWTDMEDKQPFQNAINEGGFLTFYRDHSNPDWWCCSDIRPADVATYHYNDPTFLFSIGCSTNSFWNNSSSYTGLVSESFLNAEVGAIGSLGANNVTYSQYNDLITWGMLDYFWPDYMPSLGSQSEADFYYPAYSLVAGKLFLSQQAFLPYSANTEKVNKTLNLFSYLGEAYLNLYTEVPQQMQADVPITHHVSSSIYTFTIEEGARVCISKDGEIIQVLQGTGEPQSVELPTMEGGEQFTFTATKQNYFRFEQNVTIIPVQQTAERQAIEFTLYPNPTDGKVSIVVGEDLKGKVDIEVHNLLGECLLSQTACDLHERQTLTLNLNDFVSGLYIIRLHTENGTWSKKVNIK